MTEDSIRIDADLGAVAEVGQWLRRYIADTELPIADDEVAKFDLALHELVVNSIVHGSAIDHVDIRASVNDSHLLIDVIDEGADAFDPEQVTEPIPGVAQVGGYGLMIIEKVASALDYERRDGLNHWTVQFPLAAGAPSGAA